MAIGTIVNANAAGEGPVVNAVGSRGSIVQVCSDIDTTATTAATATELLQPFSFASSNVSWVKRGPNAIRAYFFARMAVGATVTTDPVIRIYGAYPLTGATLPENNSNAIPNDGTWVYVRLDNADNNAAGITLDLVSSGTGLRADSTYAWTDETVEIDLQDCHYFTVLAETAANTNSGTVPIYARCIA